MGILTFSSGGSLLRKSLTRRAFRSSMVWTAGHAPRPCRVPHNLHNGSRACWTAGAANLEVRIEPEGSGTTDADDAGFDRDGAF